MEASVTRDAFNARWFSQPLAVIDGERRSNSRSSRRKLLSIWNRGKLSHESTGCSCRAASMSARYRARKASAWAAIRSDHHENAWDRGTGSGLCLHETHSDDITGSGLGLTSQEDRKWSGFWFTTLQKVQFNITKPTSYIQFILYLNIDQCHKPCIC